MAGGGGGGGGSDGGGGDGRGGRRGSAEVIWSEDQVVTGLTALRSPRVIG